jgi:thioredoxin-related protein
MLSAQMEGLTFPCEVEIVDIDDNFEMSAEHNVRGVPTMILLDDNGNEIKRVAGTQTKTQLMENFGASDE